VTAVFLQWTNTDPGNTDNIKVYREATNGPWGAPIATLAADVELYEDDVPDGTYWYRVTATNLDGESADVGTNIDTIAIGAPGPLVLAEFGGQVNGTAVVGTLPEPINEGNAWYAERNDSNSPVYQDDQWHTANRARNNCQVDISTANFKITVDVAAAATPGGTSSLCGRSNTTGATTPKWWFRVSYATGDSGACSILEDGTVRSSVTDPAITGEAGQLELTFDGDQLTGRAIFPSATVVVGPYTMTANLTVQNAGLLSDFMQGTCFMDNFTVEGL
jgi:hypothetical protein